MSLSVARVPTVEFHVNEWSDLDPHFTALCSEATLHDRRGFFLDFSQQVTDLAGHDFLSQLGSASTDIERLQLCYSHERVRELVRSVLNNIQPVFRSKSGSTSQQRRQEGERILRGGNLRNALTMLSQAVMWAPPPQSPAPDNSNDSSLALALWARSQALIGLNYFFLALNDIQLSIKHGLPQDLRYEAFYRMGVCQHGLGDIKRAGASYQVAARLLEKNNDQNMRNSWMASIQQAMGALRVPVQQTSRLQSKAIELKVTGGTHESMPAASSLLDVSVSPGEGRQMVAKKEIRAGDTLVVESPTAACLLPDKFGTHCHHCFSRLVAPVPCDTCTGVAFCGLDCREAASTYHRYECRFMGLLLGSGMSILCHVSLRMVTQKGLDFFTSLRPHLDCIGSGQSDKFSPEQRNYLKVLSLETHASKRPPKDFLHRSLMALFLLRILQKSGFFPKVSSEEEELTEDEAFIGSLLLRHLQLLQFNAHEVYETVILPRKDKSTSQPQSKFRSAKVVYIGVAIYPTVALFNHDCYPAVARHFIGKDIVVTALRPLSAGDVVAENYGPIFTKRNLQQRQRSLNSRYWFRCNCLACQQNWPLMENLPEDYCHLRCPTEGCTQSLSAPRDRDVVSNPECPRCKQRVDLQCLRARLSDCSTEFDIALEAMERDEPLSAISRLCRYLDQIHTCVWPPYRGIHLAQEALRTCLADGGNVWTVP